MASAALSTTGSVAGNTVNATSTPSAPPVYPGATNQPAGNWGFTLNNNFTQAEQIVINVGPGPYSATAPYNDQCISGSDYVAFSSVPTVTVTQGTVSTGDTAPSISATTVTNPTDGLSCAGIKDELVLTIANDASGNTGTTDNWNVAISGIQYNVGANTLASAGGTQIGVSGTDLSGPTGSILQTLTVAPNATLEPVSLTGNVPPVGIQTGTSGAISNLVLKEFLPGQVTGQVTVTLPASDLFLGTATVTATNSTVSNASTGTYGGSATVTLPTAGSNTFSFWATTSTVPATFTISGLKVSANNTTPGPQTVTVTTTTINAQTVAFSEIGSTRTAGYTADDTAAASFVKAFGTGTYYYENSLSDNCSIGNVTYGYYNGSYPVYAPSVVITADFTPYDALSANYLASYLGTGVLITPYGSLSSAAANIIRNYGVGCVYIVGGTSAVSQAVQDQLAAMNTYEPGGVTPFQNQSGNNVPLKVTRIAGVTADETASDVAQYPGVGAVGTIPATPGAYGSYNDTTGTGSTSGPATGNVTTAILATDVTFQDALSSGPLSYYDGLPVLVTPQGSLSNAAAAAIVNLGIQQVIIVGGPGAVSNNVASQVQALGASVLRIAGLTYSDTSVQLANFEINNTTGGTSPVVNGLAVCSGTVPGSVASSRGDFFADALTSAAAAVNDPSGDCNFDPMMLTKDTSTVGPEVTAFLNAAGSTKGIGSLGVHIYSIDVFGGTLAQTPALVQDELNAIAAG